MLDQKVLSVHTPKEELDALVGSQIFTIYLDDFVMGRVIETARVKKAYKRGEGPVVITFVDDSLVWFNDPVTISYDAKGELQ